MTVEEILALCLAKKASYVDYPFGEVPICLKVSGRIFAQIYPKSRDAKITLKCTPAMGDFYRQMYPGIVVRGYHCPPLQQPFWNTLPLDGSVPDDELGVMIDEAYDAVLQKLPKEIRLELIKSENT